MAAAANATSSLFGICYLFLCTLLFVHLSVFQRGDVFALPVVSRAIFLLCLGTYRTMAATVMNNVSMVEALKKNNQFYLLPMTNAVCHMIVVIICQTICRIIPIRYLVLLLEAYDSYTY